MHIRFALQTEYTCNLSVTIADGRTIQSTTCDHIVMEIDVNGSQTKILLQDVHVIPGLRKNLLSIGELAKKGIYTSFTKQDVSLYKFDDTGVKYSVGCATWNNGLCYLDGHAIASAVASVAEKPNGSIMEWHARLGHFNVEGVAIIENHNLADSLHITEKKRSDCDACREGYQTRALKRKQTPPNQHQRMRLAPYVA